MKLFACWIPVLCICFLLAGCGGEEYSYVDGRDLKPGPGLLSGDDGVITVYGAPSSQSRPEQQVPEKTKKDY